MYPISEICKYFGAPFGNSGAYRIKFPDNKSQENSPKVKFPDKQFNERKIP